MQCVAKGEMCSSRLDISPSHWKQPSMIAVSHCPLAITIAANGNYFFRSAVSLAVTGSQEFHVELRQLITTNT